MRAVGQARRPAAEPPRHPSGEKTAGDGTWGEGRPPIAEIPASVGRDKRATAPTIAFAGTPGESPAPTTAPLADKRDSPKPGPMVGGPGTEGPAEGAAPTPYESQDPCARKPTIQAEGSQQSKAATPSEAPRSSGVEVACQRGKVHSAAAGRSESRTVPSAAAPDGAFTVLTGEPAKSPPQGPAGGFADAPRKPAGHGTGRVDVGSCGPQSPSMTVRMPPSHPALAAAPRRKPPPSVPAFGARAALTAPKGDDARTRSPRGLGVSQVHLSGSMRTPGPRLKRTDSLAEAPSGSLPDDAAPAAQGQAATPRGTAGAGAKGAGAEGAFTPTAALAAASVRGGGGGAGGLTAAQQHATNAIRMDDVKSEADAIQSVLPTYRKMADDAREKLKPLEKAHAEYEEAVLKKEAAERAYNELAFGTGKNAINDPSNPVQQAAKAAFEGATEEMNAKEKEQRGYSEARGEAHEKQRLYEQKKQQEASLDREQQSLNAKNRKLEDGMTSTEKARADKEKARLKRDQDRQREIQKRLDAKRAKREERNSGRPDYRATQRAKARRADNKTRKSLAKAKKLLAIATSKNMSAKARKSALAKAKNQLQRAKQAALDQLKALGNAKADAARVEGELHKIEEFEKELKAAEAEIEEEDQEPAPPDPCTLPCACNILCKPNEVCVCSRQALGGLPVSGGGGGGAAEPAPPEVLVPDGVTVSEEDERVGDGQSVDDNGGATSGKRAGADGGGRALPGGIALDVKSPDGGPVYFQDDGKKDDEKKANGETPKGEQAPAGSGTPAGEKPKQKTSEQKEEERRKLRNEFIANLKAAIVAAAKELVRVPPGWPDDPDVASAPGENDWKHDEALLWKNTGSGMVVEGDPAAGLEQLFKYRGEFKLDCASAGWVAWYQGLLAVLGRDKFNGLFTAVRKDGSETKALIILGSWGSGSGRPEESSAYSELGLRPTNPTLVDYFAPGVTAAEVADCQYVTRPELIDDKGNATGGQNLLVIKGAAGEVGKKYGSTTEVYGHGSAAHGYPIGIDKSAVFEKEWGGAHGPMARLKTGWLFARFYPAED